MFPLPPAQIVTIPPLEQPAVVIRRNVATAAVRKFAGHVTMEMHMPPALAAMAGGSGAPTKPMSMSFTLIEHQTPIRGKNKAKITTQMRDFKMSGAPMSGMPMMNTVPAYTLVLDNRDGGSIPSLSATMPMQMSNVAPSLPPLPFGPVKCGQEWSPFGSGSSELRAFAAGAKVEYLGVEMIGHTPCYHLQTTMNIDMARAMKSTGKSMPTGMGPIKGDIIEIVDLFLNTADGDLQTGQVTT